MTTPFDSLRTYLESRATFTNQEVEFMRASFQPVTLRSGEFLQRAGEQAKYGTFVARGCLRSYTIDAKGKEHIVQFAPENWWLADAVSLMNKTPSQYFMDAIEDSDLMLIDSESHQRVIENVPGYAAAMRTGLQKHAAAKDQRIVHSLSASAEERYLAFLQMYPSIVLRVPQWMLASYLGVSPETLSRIRKDLSRK